MKKINWKVRVKNPYFWFGLVAIVLAAVGAKPEMFTSWEILIIQVKQLFGNPFALGCVVVAFQQVFLFFHSCLFGILWFFFLSRLSILSSIMSAL